MTDDIVSFFIEGVPVPQGSKTIGRNRQGSKTWLRDANAKRLKPWRQVVAEAADVGVTFDAPVIVWLSFVLPKPQRPRFLAPAVKPDIDKLMRAVCDGLKDGGLIGDDARIVVAPIRKRYPTPGDPTGVGIDVEEWTQEREDAIWRTHPRS
jgi:Holliday junction resolvase RusA-like endonuclease